MKKVFAVTAAFALLCLGVVAQAAITIDTVTVGDAGNAADTAVMWNDPLHESTTGFGSVSYTYNIGKYEVTAGQYCAFLNAVAKTDIYGLYSTQMTGSWGCKITRTGASGDYSYSVAADYANRPVNFVSFWDACRFTNWLSNGQKSGAQDATTTEDGAYTLNGYTGNDGSTIQRNANWKWAITSEDEWYKAAYYKGGGTDAGYWLYPTQSDSAPGTDMNDPYGNNANYYNGTYLLGGQPYRTVVGEFQNSESAYGTFDQGGNILEWNETFTRYNGDSAYRGMRGGSFYSAHGYSVMQSTCRSDYQASAEYRYTGFRVVQAVPEPSSLLALATGALGLVGFAARRKK